MTKNILGGLSLLMVAFMVIIFFFPPENDKEKHKSETPKQENKTKTKKKVASDPALLASLPEVTSADWQLLLVNDDHPIKQEAGKLVALKNGYLIDERVYEAYYEMEAAALEAGFSLIVLSGYRSVADQQIIYDSDINKHMAKGLSEKEAKAKTLAYVTYPGTSEHHTGLAIDVIDQEWYALENDLVEEFYDTPVGKWLDKNASKYGYIIRYPRGKEALTKINYEPWHLRYVGKESALFMSEHDLVLEEYLALIKEAGH